MDTRPCEPVKITSANADERIREAIEVLIRCWDEWEGEAGQDAQVEQDNEAYFGSMTAQIDAVLRGMVFDPDPSNPCDHGVPDGEYCDECREAYRAAEVDPDNGLVDQG